MDLSAHYIPAQSEGKWYAHWKKKGYFRSVPDERKPYTIVIPPPNVTGVLHMGHTLNETIQDILIRRARMSGFNACWVPGSDHASIATEARVVAMLKEKGIEKSSLTRAQFLAHAFEWKEKYGHIIYSQLERLGCSCDWDRLAFTMDDHYYRAVIRVFVQLYEKGLIYRGARMIHWDPSAQTALSDEEVEYREVHSVLYYIRYPIENAPDPSFSFVTIATTRPETILGDSALAVHPQDLRYKALKGAKARVPLIDREIPVIFDEYVDREFGTGCLKITPAHDLNDYNLGLKHGLEVIDILNPDGTLSKAAQLFVGEDRFVARKNILRELQEKGFLVKEETILNKNGFSQRTDAVVEPRISTQWFLKVKELSEPALDAVKNGDIRIHPADRFLNSYYRWMENLQDWCLSRQLWWGQRIPAWYDPQGNIVVAETAEAAREKYLQSNPGTQTALIQDEDVLDTWFSSWLWPIEVFHGISDPASRDLGYYYPTSVLVTGQDIIFFWVSRMIMAGYAFEKEAPFKDVYFTGMVRDKQGRKMSKSLGNSPDLLQLIDDYGSDAVRFGIMISSPAGNDLLFDVESCQQGRHFCNKLWNALKLFKKWEDNPFEGNDTISENIFPVLWFEARLTEAEARINHQFREFRLNEALKTLYSLIWDDFCSWYLEWIKPDSSQPMDQFTLDATLGYFEQLLELLHPFMPFFTEEIYHQLKTRPEGDDLIIRQLQKEWTQPARDLVDQGELAKAFITAIRDARKSLNTPSKPIASVALLTDHRSDYERLTQVLRKQTRIGTIEFTDNPIPGAISIVVGKDRAFIHMEGSEDNFDPEKQMEKLKKELVYLQGFLASIDSKLSNARFMEKAKPEVIAMERQKKKDAEDKISTLENGLKHLQL